MSDTIRFHNASLYSGLTGVVDYQNAVVHGVSLITSDLTATGHDLFVDETTLKEFHALGSKAKQIPVNLDHGSGITSMNGWVENFRLDNGKWRGDWHLLQSHEETPVMLERCDRQSRTFGLSLAFQGPKEGVIRDGKKCAHAEALLSADCVVRPAANKGLFSAKEAPVVDMNKLVKPTIIEHKFMDPNNPSAEPTLADVMRALSEVSATVKTQGEVQAKLVEAFNQGQSGDEGQEGEPSRDELRATLEAYHNMTDEELAAEGVTREQVNAAVGEYNASLSGQSQEGQDGGEGEGQQGQEGDGKFAGSYGGEGQAAGATAAAAGGTTAFQALQKEFIALKAKFNAKEQAEIRFAEAQEQEEVVSKFKTLKKERDDLVKFAEKVVAENEALHLHVRTGTRPVKAGVDNGVRLFHANAKGELHPFQQRIKAIEAEKKCSPGDAIKFAVKENEALHADWLQTLQA